MLPLHSTAFDRYGFALTTSADALEGTQASSATHHLVFPRGADFITRSLVRDAQASVRPANQDQLVVPSTWLPAGQIACLQHLDLPRLLLAPVVLPRRRSSQDLLLFDVLRRRTVSCSGLHILLPRVYQITHSFLASAQLWPKTDIWVPTLPVV